jgi:hypothetical protein
MKNRKEGVSRDMMFQAFPEIYSAEEENELENLNQTINNDNARERIPSISKDIGEKEINLSEPIINEAIDKSKNIDIKVN